jgi:hypothetical protein
MPTTISGSTGVTFPAGGAGNTAGAAVGTTDTQTLTNKTIQGGAITSGTAVASTSGTSIDFTSIPSWVKRITVMFQGISTNGASPPTVQIGDFGGIETSGYLGAIGRTGTGTAGANNSTGFLMEDDSGATAVLNGNLILTLFNASTNTWTAMGIFGRSDSANVFSQGGYKSLSATLDRVRITTTGGTDTFDAGSINILYE